MSMHPEAHSDTYKTIARPSEEVIFKDRGSKFLGYAYPIQSEEQVKTIIQNLKDAHPKARHWCYAWRLGTEDANIQFRANDDGEPNNSAGQPIYGQLLSFEITNVLVVVVRYFGGTKLGVGGLINAYRAAASLALENAEVIEKVKERHINLVFDYKDMNKVMRVIKSNQLSIVSQNMELQCNYTLAVRENAFESVVASFKSLRCVEIKED